MGEKDNESSFWIGNTQEGSFNIQSQFDKEHNQTALRLKKGDEHESPSLEIGLQHQLPETILHLGHSEKQRILFEGPSSFALRRSSQDTKSFILKNNGQMVWEVDSNITFHIEKGSIKEHVSDLNVKGDSQIRCVHEATRLGTHDEKSRAFIEKNEEGDLLFTT